METRLIVSDRSVAGCGFWKYRSRVVSVSREVGCIDHRSEYKVEVLYQSIVDECIIVF